MKSVFISIEISTKFVAKGQIVNNPELVSIMAWHLTGDKPLSEPMLTRFTEVYMRPLGKWVNPYKLEKNC